MGMCLTLAHYVGWLASCFTQHNRSRLDHSILCAPVSLSSYEAHFGSAEQSAEVQLHQCSVCDPAKYKFG
jgi:hypothetical protein